MASSRARPDGPERSYPRAVHSRDGQPTRRTRVRAIRPPHRSSTATPTRGRAMRCESRDAAVRTRRTPVRVDSPTARDASDPTRAADRTAPRRNRFPPSTSRHTQDIASRASGGMKSVAARFVRWRLPVRHKLSPSRLSEKPSPDELFATLYCPPRDHRRKSHHGGFVAIRSGIGSRLPLGLPGSERPSPNGPF
jgi:hypothetical protein